MISIFVALHVLAAIALIGPVMVSTSKFPAGIAAARTDVSALGSLKTLAGITQTYGMFSALAPILGVAVFVSDISTFGSMGQFHGAMALAVVAWCILLFIVAPKQKAVVTALETGDSSFDFDKARSGLAMFGGIFNLLWIICAILMFI